MSNVQRVTLESSYILHQRPFKDSGLLLDVFSSNHGRVTLIAKGVRKKRGRWQNELQPFVPLLLSWSGRGELANVTDAELSGSALMLSGKCLLSAYYINELVLYLVHRHDPQPEIFECYCQTLSELSRLSALPSMRQELEKCLRLFERDLLELAGYGLVLDYDVKTGGEVIAEREYIYDMQSGPVLVDHDVEFEVYLGESLLALSSGRLVSPGHYRDAKRLLRRAIDQQLGGRELKSRKMMLDLLRTTGNNAGQ